MKVPLRLLVLFLLFLTLRPGLAGITQRDKNPEIFEVLPNPGSGLYTVYYRSEQKTPQMLAVCDATGKFVFLKTIHEFTGELRETVDLSGYPKGIYIFEVEHLTGRDVKKVILQ